MPGALLGTLVHAASVAATRAWNRMAIACSAFVPGGYGGFLGFALPAPLRRQLAFLVVDLEGVPPRAARAALARVVRDRRARVANRLDDLERLDRERVLPAHLRARSAHRLLHASILQR